METKIAPLRETYYSETYKNKLYEREQAKPKNIRDFVGTYTQNDATYHNLGVKQDADIYKKRAVDHRDFIGGAQRPGTISGNVKKTNTKADLFKNHSDSSDSAGIKERKHYAYKKTADDLVGTNVLHQSSHEESKKITESWKVPVKERRVTAYMNSSAMKDCLTLPTKVGEIEPKAAVHGFGTAKPRDVWAPKAYRPHANAGNQRFYID